MINDQNKSKVFLAIIAILLIANITMLVFLLQKKEPARQVNRPDKKAFISNLLKEGVGFNQQQLSQYDTLSNRHREKVRKLFESIRTNKTVQFKQLAAADFAESVISKIAEESAALQTTVDINMFKHIKDIRKLCSPVQLTKFDSVFIKVFNWREEARKKTEK